MPGSFAQVLCLELDSRAQQEKAVGVEDRHFCDLITGSKNPGRMNYVPFMGCLFLLVLKMDGFMK